MFYSVVDQLAGRGDGMAKVGIETRKRTEVHVTKEDIKDGLKKLGLKRGDNIGVHSSLSSFGYVEGGADAIIDALLETVGEEGTVVMPTYSNNTQTLEKTQQEIDMGVTWKYRVLAYNPKKDGCWTGKIPDTFWRTDGAIRNSNLTHSLTAVGASSEKLSQNWKKLLDADGYILLLGVTLGCCSSMHLAEEYVQLPQHILDKITPPPELQEKYERENIGFGFGPYPDFEKMEEICRKHNIMKSVRIGEATVKLLRLRELISLYAEYLRKDPDLFYQD
jgi:aminoglycoside 3-N-acetyltransferase